MVERLLFDGIDAETAGAPIRGQHHGVAPPAAHEAQPALAIVQLAVARAQVALQTAVVQLVPVIDVNDGIVFGNGFHERFLRCTYIVANGWLSINGKCGHN